MKKNLFKLIYYGTDYIFIRIYTFISSCDWSLLFSGKSSQNLPLWVALLVGLFAGYISLLIFNTLIPSLNSYGAKVGNYVVSKSYSGMDNMNYFMVFPPLLAILIVFLVLLYNGSLG